jgi:hypothetical protein
MRAGSAGILFNLSREEPVSLLTATLLLRQCTLSASGLGFSSFAPSQKQKAAHPPAPPNCFLPSVT